jgi:hypothetical protein
MIETETLILKMKSVSFEERRLFLKQIIKNILNSEDSSLFFKT